MASPLALRPALLSCRSLFRLFAVAGLSVGVFLTSMASAYAAAPHVPLLRGGEGAVVVAPQLLVGPGAVADGLYPGGKVALTLTVTNLADDAVTLTRVVDTGTTVTGGAGQCGARDFSVRVSAPSGTVISAGASRELVLPDAVTMLTTAGEGCQGVTVGVRVAVTAQNTDTSRG